jgi:RNA polymerase sigma factor (sigma-70 family)
LTAELVANFSVAPSVVVAVDGSVESDAAAIAASVADPARFATVYERHLAAVAAYLTRRVGRELAEDLSAEVFVRAFRARASFRPDHDTARPWLFGIAGNLVADHRRAERRRLRGLQRVASAGADGVAPELAGVSSELARCLLALPAADRDTLLLVVWGELSYEEAATALGVPIGTIRSRIARARRRLSVDLETGGREASPTSGIESGGAHV